MAAALLIVAADAAHAANYDTARRLYGGRLYGDCAATDAKYTERRQSCADYLGQLLDNWNLNQDVGVCARHVGKELPDVYVRYWRARGLGFLSGRFRSG